MGIVAKYQVDTGETGVHGRFSELYESGSAGKSVLLAQCVAGGMILKECGLLDLITQIDSSQAYKAGTASERRALLLAELRSLFGQAAPVSAIEPPAVPVAAYPEPVAEQPPATTQATTPTPVPRQIGSRRPSLPQLGQSLDDE